MIRYFVELMVVVLICVFVGRYVGLFKFIPISERTAIILVIILAVVGFFAFGWFKIKTGTITILEV